MRLTSRKRGRHTKIELCMTSMIDCIFLLLIFFMLNTGVQLTERNLEAGIDSQQKAKGKKSDLDPIVVEFVKAGGDYVFKLGGNQFTRAEQLTEALRKLASRGGPSFVKVTDNVPFDKAATAIQCCYDAGYVSVTYVPAGR